MDNLLKKQKFSSDIFILLIIVLFIFMGVQWLKPTPRGTNIRETILHTDNSIRAVK